MDVQIIKASELPPSSIARELIGADHGGLGVCIIFVDALSGEGQSLHKTKRDRRCAPVALASWGQVVG